LITIATQKVKIYYAMANFARYICMPDESCITWHARRQVKHAEMCVSLRAIRLRHEDTQMSILHCSSRI